MIVECSDCKYYEADFLVEPCVSCVNYRNFSPVVDSNTEKEIRAEAIKEFAKFLIGKSNNGKVYNFDIPDLVKEFEGENE